MRMFMCNSKSKCLSILLLFYFLVASQGKSVANKFQLKVNNLKKGKIPKILSGPLPECLPIPWQIVDPCHEHVCEDGAHVVVSVCDKKGKTCSEGEYLKVPSNPKVASDCCKCAPFDK